MRKLLLATSALLGASVGIAGVANAATLTPNAPNPAPGSITVTLNALVEAFVFGGTDSGNNGGPGNTKRTDYAIGSYTRLYPSFDGVLANGLKYGASIELRQNSGASSTGPTVFVQRDFLYVGADKFGKISLGSAAQPSELFQSGNEVGFNTGGWDGDLPSFFNGGGLKYMLDDDRDQAEKIVYVSPQVAGFDFGVSYEPNSFNNNFGDATARISSAPTLAPIAPATASAAVGRRRNTIDAALRYQGALGPFALKADIAASYGGSVRSSDGGPNVRDFTLYGGGLAATFGGFEVGGHIDTGVYGNDLANLPRGASGTTAYIGGAQYTFGPFVVGANYYAYDSGQYKANGATAATATAAAVGAGGGLHGYGVAAGGTYTLAPGASVFLEYLYGQQRAANTDIIANAPGNIHNRVRAQGFGIGTAFKW